MMGQAVFFIVARLRTTVYGENRDNKSPICTRGFCKSQVRCFRDVRCSNEGLCLQSM
jgi:hypothetical protein